MKKTSVTKKTKPSSVTGEATEGFVDGSIFKTLSILGFLLSGKSTVRRHTLKKYVPSNPTFNNLNELGLAKALGEIREDLKRLAGPHLTPLMARIALSRTPIITRRRRKRR